MSKRVAIAARDLLFRAKLRTAVESAGGTATPPDGEADIALIELGQAGADERIRAWVARGVPVLAFGSHVQPDALRAARALGARAVPNSQIEPELIALLTAP